MLLVSSFMYLKILTSYQSFFYLWYVLLIHKIINIMRYIILYKMYMYMKYTIFGFLLLFSPRGLSHAPFLTPFTPRLFWCAFPFPWQNYFEFRLKRYMYCQMMGARMGGGKHCGGGVQKGDAIRTKINLKLKHSD